jgi:hypothetical protein
MFQEKSGNPVPLLKMRQKYRKLLIFISTIDLAVIRQKKIRAKNI